MTPQMQAIFEPLRKNLERRQLTDVDLFHIIGEFAETSPVIARALAFHARDILQEKNHASEEIGYGQLVAEVYSRTFFDEATVYTYGTAQMLEKGPETLREFAQYLITAELMDRIIENVASAEGSDSTH